MRDAWDTPMGGAPAPFSLTLRALCTDVPAGHSLGLALALHHPLYAPANEDDGLRVGVGCAGGASRLELPIAEIPPET